MIGGKQLRECAEMALERFFCWHCFKVTSYELLLPGDYAQLHRGFKRWVEFEFWMDAFCTQKLFDALSGFVVAYYRKKR